jgi:hypothetical protein
MKIAAPLLALLLASSAAIAAAEEGWITMFDGKTLDGWKANENTKAWSVEEGTIKAAGDRSHLYFVGDEKPFKNFHFKAEVMTKENSNSGIFFHTQWQESGWPAHGYEAQVNNTYNRDPQKTGGLYNTEKVLTPPAKDNVWFTYEIIVQGQHIQVLIDGKKVVDYTEPKDKSGTVKLSPTGGAFALQAHDPGSTVYFRNLQVKRLDDK